IRNFTNDEYDITTPEGIKFAGEVLDYIRSKIVKFQEETGNLYNLEATPAEGATYRFAKEDKKRFPDIITAGEGENIYYTNSSQVPANYTDDPFEVLSLQDDLQCKYTGGTVLHVYLKEHIQNPEICRNLLKKILTNYRLPYITLTPLITVCPIHGRLDKNYEYCPKCDEELINKYLQEVDSNG
ncbi:MAG: anaerobic ribonucleoside-triphosphate reductase, partial [Sulfurihydrogenibium azorense]